MTESKKAISALRQSPAGPSISGALGLIGKIQPFHWGKVGASSRIAPFIPGVAPETPLAEYWIGSHPKGCADVQLSGGELVPLADLARDRWELFGAGRPSQGLPFIVKVLSVDPSWGLSIQAHPDRERARRLHILDPINYPDTNHKPEIGIPLTAVTLLYGFRSHDDVAAVLRRFHELAGVLPPELLKRCMSCDASVDQAQLRRELFSAIFHAPREDSSRVIKGLVTRFSGLQDLPLEMEIVTRLLPRYGESDVGLLAIFFMNIVTVLPGRVIFIGPNVPHAYLEGDLVECMACSDNVVRAGLTPKFKDVETLLEMLDYSVEQPPLVVPKPEADGFAHIALPVQEFTVSLLPLGSGSAECVVGERAEVLLCLGETASIRSPKGEVLELTDGGAALLPAKSGPFVIERSKAAVFRFVAGESA